MKTAQGITSESIVFYFLIKFFSHTLGAIDSGSRPRLVLSREPRLHVQAVSHSEFNQHVEEESACETIVIDCECSLLGYTGDASAVRIACSLVQPPGIGDLALIEHRLECLDWKTRCESIAAASPSQGDDKAWLYNTSSSDGALVARINHLCIVKRSLLEMVELAIAHGLNAPPSLAQMKKPTEHGRAARLKLVACAFCGDKLEPIAGPIFTEAIAVYGDKRSGWEQDSTLHIFFSSLDRGKFAGGEEMVLLTSLVDPRDVRVGIF